MLMKTKLGLRNLQQNQKGVASFLITMFIMIVLGLIVLGFSQLTRRDQRQSLDRQLSTQAYYAAESGINDAIDELKKPASPYRTSQKGDCTPLPGYNNVLDLSAGISYSCLLIDSTPPSIERQGVGFNTNAVFPIQLVSGAQVRFIKIEWRDQNPNNNATSCPAGGLFPATRNPSCKIALLRADVVPYGTATTPTRDTLINTLYTVFANPVNGGTGTAFYSAGGDPDNAVGNCSAATPANCSITIDTTAASSDRFFLRLNSIYGMSDVTITASDGSAYVDLQGGQAVIDATGRAGDVVKRVQVRVSLGSNDGLAGFALQTANVECKRFGTIPATNQAVLISPAAVGNICDPTSSSTTGP